MKIPLRAGGRRARLPLPLGVLATVLAPATHAQPHEALEEIVVTGVLRDRAPGELAQSVTVVRGDTLDRVRAANLGETLANQLGVSSSYFGAGASRPIIRGLAGARVQMLEDGLDAMDAATVSDDHAVTVEPLAADQIEIFRGPTSLLYGSGAVGGVVNTVTTRVPSRAPEDGLLGAFELRADTVAESRGAAVRLDGGGERLAWHFDAGHRDSDDYEIPGFAHADADAEDAFGVVENSAAESDSAALGASWLNERGFIGVSVSAFDTLYGLPGHAHSDESEEGEAVRIDLEQRRVDLRGRWEGLPGFIEAANAYLGVGNYEHIELEGDAVGTLFTNDATELRLELLHRSIGRWTGAFGAQLADREFAAVGEEAFVPPVATTAAGVFLVEQRGFAAWDLSLGGRLETQEHRPSNGLPVVDQSATSFSLGAVRSFGDTRELVVTLARSERLPVAEELYSDGPHLASGVVQIGDAALDTEISQHVDVGVRGRMGQLNWGVTGFRTHYDDFIYLGDTGAVDPIHALPVFVYRQAEATFTGIEVEVFIPLMADRGHEVDLRLFTDYVRGELTTGESLPRLPPLRYGARFEYHNERLLVGVEGTRYDDQDDTAPFEEETAGYLLLNADVRWRFAAAAMDLELFLNGSNLGDEEARKHTSFVKDVAPLPGRNYAVGIRSRF
jgi:iron complex outermembrane receptor protein